MLFVEALKEAGTQQLEAPERPLIIHETIRVSEDDAELIAVPSDDESLNILYDLDYGPDAPMAPQSACSTLA